jgi:hypothetical protein
LLAPITRIDRVNSSIQSRHQSSHKSSYQSSEQIDQLVNQLVKQWSSTQDAVKANAMLRQIALLTGYSQAKSVQLTELEQQRVLQWLQERYPYAYLLAMSQQSVGHPAMIWGRNLQVTVSANRLNRSQGRS